MIISDIKEFEIGDYCFSKHLTINGKDYEDYSKEEILEFIDDFLKNDINPDITMREIFENLLEHLEFDLVESDSSTCEQCGDWNSYQKYKK